ncbi:Group B oligopeptidase PepB [Gracilariopsis chorda]|uniref:Group B oligopeptidase PepB n=1 Tax=Gracilariopsis chorda TaxID=448386 RepID=A0A2V3IQS2_9FLOR|nr:Group B oligopeptidase PepB [Gracilariopsis chorda]|eukprot:PXF44456.1 Group B oligopeptidase PepB [Gracilariopsis chorda]
MAMFYVQSKAALLIVCTLPVFFAFTHASLDPSPKNQYQGPSWVLPYSSTEDPSLLSNLDEAKECGKLMNETASEIRHLVDKASDITLAEAHEERLIPALVSMNKNYWKGFALLFDAGVYVSERLNVDGTDRDAQVFGGKVNNILIPFLQAHLPAAIILKLCKDEVFEEFLNSDESAKEAEFFLREARKLKPHALSFAEENIITGLSDPGFTAWKAVWGDCSSAVNVTLELNGVKEEMGLAAVISLIDHPDSETRHQAWMAERKGWLSIENPLAAALNSITKWRFTNDKLRNHASSLTETLSAARMTKPSHDAMFRMIEKHAKDNRGTLRIQAEAWGKQVLDPWDLWASSPLETEEDLVPFDQAIDLIAEVVGEYVPEAREFVKGMRDDKLIEASIGNTKKSGAHCAFFPVQKVPVVYMDSFNGGRLKLNVLAHELGHAYHVEIMKGLPLSQMIFGLNLAETASLFFEAIIDDKMLSEANDLKDSVSAHYRTNRRVADYLLHRPTRFEFEVKMHEQVEKGKLSKSVVNDLMVESWKQYYGDAVSELDEMGYFAYKTLHYYKTDTPFYNWQYSFGYLMAEKLFQKCKENKSSCKQVYHNFFMDSGTMTAEELVQKHLDYDISQDTIWEEIAIEVENKINRFKTEWEKYKGRQNNTQGTCEADGAQCK